MSDDDNIKIKLDVVMKSTFKDKIDWFTNNYDKEIGGFILGSIGEEIVMEDLLIPEQEADSATIDISGKQQILMVKEYGKEVCQRIIGEWHSHHSMSGFWSSDDEGLIKDWAEPRDISVFIVSSRKDGHRVRVEVRKPFKMSLDNLDYCVEFDENLEKFLLEEIEKKVKKKEYKPSKESQSDFRYSWEDYKPKINTNTKSLFTNNTVLVNMKVKVFGLTKDLTLDIFNIYIAYNPKLYQNNVLVFEGFADYDEAKDLYDDINSYISSYNGLDIRDRSKE